MAISTIGAISSVPLVLLPPVSQRRDPLKLRERRVVGLGRQTVSFVSGRQPLSRRRMMQSVSLVWKSVPHYSRHREQQSSFLMRVSAVEAQTVKEKAHTPVVAPRNEKTPSLDDGGNGNAPYDMDGTGGIGRGGWGGWGGGGGGANWGPSSGGWILFGILLFLNYLKDLEKDKDDEDEGDEDDENEEDYEWE